MVLQSGYASKKLSIARKASSKNKGFKSPLRGSDIYFRRLQKAGSPGGGNSHMTPTPGMLVRKFELRPYRLAIRARLELYLTRKNGIVSVTSSWTRKEAALANWTRETREHGACMANGNIPGKSCQFFYNNFYGCTLRE